MYTFKWIWDRLRVVSDILGMLAVIIGLCIAIINTHTGACVCGIGLAVRFVNMVINEEVLSEMMKRF